jgi:hypothetical protein
MFLRRRRGEAIVSSRPGSEEGVMTKRWWAGLALVAVAVAIVAAGCDGGDDTTATTTTTTTASEGNTRLTADQWSAYQTSKETFVGARDTATEKLQTCNDSSVDEFNTCIGPSLDDVETAATDLGDTLAGFDGTVTGDCASALAVLEGYVKPYVNAVQTLQSAIDSGNAAEVSSAKTNLETLSTSGKDETESFEKACAAG